MKVEIINTSDLSPYAKNAKLHSDSQIEAISKSIKEFGFCSPVLIDKDNGIIAGHGRILAAQKLKLEQVPCIRLAHLTDTQRRAYILADNRLAETGGGWSEDLLKLELQDLQSLDFDLALTGFDGEFIANLNGGTEGLTDPDDVPEPPEVPTAKLGDIWQLGNHRLMCGDSTSKEQVEKLMDGQKADMVFTDPPYNVAVTGGTHDSRDKKNFGKGPKILNDSMSDGDFKLFLLAAFRTTASVVKQGATVYVAHADSEGINFRTAFVESGFDLKQCLVWVKQQFVFGRSDYHWQHEPILYGWLKGAAHSFYGERNQSTTWHIDRPMRSEKNHPTQKPVELVEKAIGNSSKSGDVLFEPFGGGGSTLVACEKTGRICRVMELDPKYCDVIIKRWENFTGKKAVLLDNA